jgi:RYK receptor-like tyrosine kinase
MAGLTHTNIVQLLAVSGLVDESTDQSQICLEYCNGTSLESILEKNEKITDGTITNVTNIKISTLVKYMIDVATGMDYIAKAGIVHRDLAARNILLCQCTDESSIINYETCTAKIADFGLSKVMDQLDPKGPGGLDGPDSKYFEMTVSGPLPARWIAPEVLTGTSPDFLKFRTSTDIWAFGVTLWETISLGNTPYNDLNETNAFIAYLNGEERLTIPKGCPPQIYAIMESCWKKKRTERPSFEDLIKQLTAANSTLISTPYEDKVIKLYVVARPTTSYEYFKEPHEYDTATATEVFVEKKGALTRRRAVRRVRPLEFFKITPRTLDQQRGLVAPYTMASPGN